MSNYGRTPHRPHRPAPWSWVAMRFLEGVALVVALPVLWLVFEFLLGPLVAAWGV